MTAEAKFVPNWVYNISTTVLNGGVPMVIFFFVSKRDYSPVKCLLYSLFLIPASVITILITAPIFVDTTISTIPRRAIIIPNNNSPCAVL